MKVEELLEILSKKLRKEQLALDDEGICRFSVREEINLTVERSLDEGIFFLYAPIGLMPVRLKEQCEIQKKLLEGNLFGQGTGHASIGFDPSSTLIILFQNFEESTTEPQQFVEEVELFLGFVEFWRSELASAEKESLSGVHRLDDPDINYISGKNIQLLMV